MRLLLSSPHHAERGHQFKVFSSLLGAQPGRSLAHPVKVDLGITYCFLFTSRENKVTKLSALAALFSLAQRFQLVPRDRELNHQISIFIREEFLFSQACDRNNPANSSRSSSTTANMSEGRGCERRGISQVTFYLGLAFQPCSRNCESTNNFGF